MAGGGAVPHAGLRRDARAARPLGAAGRDHLHFVNDGIERALDQARKAAGDQDVRIAGGGATILAYVNAGMIDEFSLALAPVLLGSGTRLFEGVDAAAWPWSRSARSRRSASPT